MLEKRKQLQEFLLAQKAKPKLKNSNNFDLVYTDPTAFINTYQETLNQLDFNYDILKISVVQHYFLSMEVCSKSSTNEAHQNLKTLFDSLLPFLDYNFNRTISESQGGTILHFLSRKKKYDIILLIINYFQQKNYECVLTWNFEDFVTNKNQEGLEFYKLLTPYYNNSELIKNIFNTLLKIPFCSQDVILEKENATLNKLSFEFSNLLKNKKFDDIIKLSINLSEREISNLYAQKFSGFNFLNTLIDVSSNEMRTQSNNLISEFIKCISKCSVKIKLDLFFNSGNNSFLYAISKGCIKILEHFMHEIKLLNIPIPQKCFQDHNKNNIFHYVGQLKANRNVFYNLCTSFLNSNQDLYPNINVLLNSANKQGHLPINKFLINYDDRDAELISALLKETDFTKNTNSKDLYDNYELNYIRNSKNKKSGRLGKALIHPSEILANTINSSIFDPLLKFLINNKLFNPHILFKNKNYRTVLQQLNKSTLICKESANMIFDSLFENNDYTPVIEYGETYLNFNVVEVVKFINKFAPENAGKYLNYIIQGLRETTAKLDSLFNGENDIQMLKINKRKFLNGNSFFLLLKITNNNFELSNNLTKNFNYILSKTFQSKLGDVSKKEASYYYTYHEKLFLPFISFANNIANFQQFEAYVTFLIHHSTSNNLFLTLTLLSNHLTEEKFNYLNQIVRSNGKIIFYKFKQFKLNQSELNYTFSFIASLDDFINCYDVRTDFSKWFRKLQLLVMILNNLPSSINLFFKHNNYLCGTEFIKNKAFNKNKLEKLYIRLILMIVLLPDTVKNCYLDIIKTFVSFAYKQTFKSIVDQKNLQNIDNMGASFGRFCLTSQDTNNYTDAMNDFFLQKDLNLNLQKLEEETKLKYEYYILDLIKAIINKSILRPGSLNKFYRVIKIDNSFENYKISILNLVNNILPIISKNENLLVKEIKILFKNYVFPQSNDSIIAKGENLKKIKYLKVIQNIFNSNKGEKSIDCIFNRKEILHLFENFNYNDDEDYAMIRYLNSFLSKNPTQIQNCLTYFNINYLVQQNPNPLKIFCPNSSSIVSFNIFSFLIDYDNPFKNKIDYVNLIKNLDYVIKSSTNLSYSQEDPKYYIKFIGRKKIDIIAKNLDSFINDCQEQGINFNDLLASNHIFSECLALLVFYTIQNNKITSYDRKLEKLVVCLIKLPNLFKNYTGYNLKLLMLTVKICVEIVNKTQNLHSLQIKSFETLLKVPSIPNYNSLDSFISSIITILNSLIRCKETIYLSTFIDSIKNMKNDNKLVNLVLKDKYICNLVYTYLIFNDDVLNFRKLDELCTIDYMMNIDLRYEFGYASIKTQNNKFTKQLFKFNNTKLYYLCILLNKKNIISYLKTKISFECLNINTLQNSSIESSLKYDLRTSVLFSKNIEYILEFSDLFKFETLEDYKYISMFYRGQNVISNNIKHFIEYFEDFNLERMFVSCLLWDNIPLAEEILIYSPNQKEFILKCCEVNGDRQTIFSYFILKNKWQVVNLIIKNFDNKDQNLLQMLKRKHTNNEDEEWSDNALDYAISNKAFYAFTVLINLYESKIVYDLLSCNNKHFTIELISLFNICATFKEFVKNENPCLFVKLQVLAALNNYKNKKNIGSDLHNWKPDKFRILEHVILSGANDLNSYVSLNRKQINNKNDIFVVLYILIDILKLCPDFDVIDQLNTYHFKEDENYWIQFLWFLGNEKIPIFTNLEKYLNKINYFDFKFLGADFENIKLLPEYSDYINYTQSFNTYSSEDTLNSLNENLFEIYLNMCASHFTILPNMLFNECGLSADINLMKNKIPDEKEILYIAKNAFSDINLSEKILKIKKSKNIFAFDFNIHCFYLEDTLKKDAFLSLNYWQYGLIYNSIKDPLSDLLHNKYLEIFQLIPSKNPTIYEQAKNFNSDMTLLLCFLLNTENFFYKLNKLFMFDSKFKIKENIFGAVRVVQKLFKKIKGLIDKIKDQYELRGVFTEYLDLITKTNLNQNISNLFSFVLQSLKENNLNLEFLKEFFNENLDSNLLKLIVSKNCLMSTLDYFSFHSDILIKFFENIRDAIFNVEVANSSFENNFKKYFKNVLNEYKKESASSYKHIAKTIKSHVISLHTSIVFRYELIDKNDGSKAGEIMSDNIQLISDNIVGIMLDWKYNTSEYIHNESELQTKNIVMTLPYYFSENDREYKEFTTGQNLINFLSIFFNNLSSILINMVPSKNNLLPIYPEFIGNKEKPLKNLGNICDENSTTFHKLFISLLIKNRIYLLKNIDNELDQYKMVFLCSILEGENEDKLLNNDFISLPRGLTDNQALKLKLVDYISNLKNYKICTFSQFLTTFLFKQNLESKLEFSYSNFIRIDSEYKLYLYNLILKSHHWALINSYIKCDTELTLDINYDKLYEILNHFIKANSTYISELQVPVKQTTNLENFIKIRNGAACDSRKLIDNNKGVKLDKEKLLSKFAERVNNSVYMEGNTINYIIRHFLELLIGKIVISKKPCCLNVIVNFNLIEGNKEKPIAIEDSNFNLFDNYFAVPKFEITDLIEGYENEWTLKILISISPSLIGGKQLSLDSIEKEFLYYLLTNDIEKDRSKYGKETSFSPNSDFYSLSKSKEVVERLDLLLK